MNTNLYPWQDTQWQQVVSGQNKNRVAHALLISGQEGVGKYVFSTELARWLLCLDAGTDTKALCSDKKCRSCHLFHSKTHPDYHAITSSAEQRIIKIEQIRNLIEFTQQTSHLGRGKVIILYPGENIHYKAAQALLKTLEEPPAGVYILLVSHAPNKLLATIRSRCQKIIINPNETSDKKDIISNWLAKQIQPDLNIDINELLSIANGAPLRALSLSQSENWLLRETIYQDLDALKLKKSHPVIIAEQWQKFKLQDIIFWLSNFMVNLAKTNHANTLSLNKFDFFEYWQSILETNKFLINHIAINVNLAVESLLIDFVELMNVDK